jgi:phage tail sheath protein FI
MSETDRDKLSDVRINPISNSADSGWAITGQKTLQMKRSSLDRINVRRMLVEVKRQIIKAALKVMFEQNDASTRAALKKTIEEKLGFVKAQSGIDNFIVRIDESNNTQDDIDLNKMNCAIAVVPVRSVEYVVIDFIVTRSGVTFV